MSHTPSPLEVKLNLKTMTLLIVDSNDFSRSFTRNVCAGFRFNKILTAGNANEAVEHMRSTEAQMMLTDWLLQPGSGEALVRNVRRLPTIRNPFLPIIVLSGQPDRASIAQARDAGANEFMPRPFDLKQLLQRFAQVLLTPRSFVRVPSYVGPDRRRKQLPYDGPDRRAASRPADFKPSSATDAAEKAAGPGGNTLRAMAAVGEKIIVSEEVRYRDVRRQDLEALTALFAALLQHQGPTPGITEQIYLKSNALKSMGQTFGFPLLTEAGDSLCRLLWKLPADRALAPLTVQGIDAHIRTMRLIVDQDIRHDGGEIGAQLIDGLRTLGARVAESLAIRQVG
jgi:two-component system, chemotaxis family, chemotaxis protein CheY